MTERAQAASSTDVGDGAFLDVVLATNDGLLVVDALGVVLFANPAAERLLRCSSGELAGVPFGLPLVGGDDELAELDVVLPDGELVVVDMHVAPIRWHGRGAQVVTLRDVTDRVTAQRRVQASEDRYALSAAAVNDGLWEWDSRTGLVHTSARLHEMLGFPARDADDHPSVWLGRIHLDDQHGLRRMLEEHVAGALPRVAHEVRLRCRDGTWRWVLIRGLAVREQDRVVRLAGSVTDISERRDAESALRRLALHDPLTGLANRALIRDHLKTAIAHWKRAGGVGFGVLFLDLDHFKLVNDSLGHAMGDALLVQVARRIETCVRTTDTVGRLGGDEFVVILEAPAPRDSVLKTVHRIREALSAPIRIGTEVLHTTASIGVLLSEDVAADPETVLRDADAAMYAAKTHGRDGFQVFASTMHDESAERMRLRTALRRAAASGHLFVRYQPVVDLNDGRVVAFEALLRWAREDGEVLDAEQFIDLAEETGVIVSAGWNVLTTACLQVASWRRAGFPVRVAVNLADGQVTSPDLTERVTKALAAAGIAPEALQLEITERVAMTRPLDAAAHLQECRDLGIDVLVDDFGTGYSSLRALADLPATALKIDKSFVARLGADMDAIVSVIVGLGGSLGLEIIAEGIETVDQCRRLLALGCHEGQGYLYGAALDAVDATRLLEEQASEVGLGR